MSTVARLVDPLKRVEMFDSWDVAFTFAHMVALHGFTATKPIVHQGIRVWFVSWTALP